MTLRALQCPNCSAPVEELRGASSVCRYCGATLVSHPAEPARTETHYTLALRVGPSNVDRIAAVLAQELELAPAAAHSLVSGSPCQVPMGTGEGRAQALARALVEAGGQVEITERLVPIRSFAVRLEAAGPRKIAAIAALREFLDLGLKEAKELVESAPVVLVESMEEPRARALAAALESAGARARLG